LFSIFGLRVDGFKLLKERINRRGDAATGRIIETQAAIPYQSVELPYDLGRVERAASDPEADT
jgi:hypothetical protein